MAAKRSNEHAPEVTTKRAKFLAHARAGHPRDSATAALVVLGEGIIASSSRHKVIVWDLDQQALKMELFGHTEDVTALVVLPEIASGIVSGSADRSVKVWNFLTGVCVATLQGHESGVHALAVLEDGTLASSSSRWICVWDLTSHTLLTLLHTHTSYPTRTIAGLPRDRLASACDDGVVMMHAVKTAGVLRSRGGHTDEGVAMCVLPDQRLATAAHNGVVRLWNELPDQGWNELQGHKSPVNVMSMLPDESLATGSRDCTIRIWNVKNCTCLRTLTGHTGPILALVFFTRR